MNCKLIGSVFQALEATLNQDECFYAERGSLIYMDTGINQEVLMSGNGLMNVISSKLSGESLFYSSTKTYPMLQRKWLYQAEPVV